MKKPWSKPTVRPAASSAPVDDDEAAPAVKLSWTQPICIDCYEEKREGEGWTENPYTIKPPLRVYEVCCSCGLKTKAGIYVRIDPTTVQFPRRNP